MGAMVNDNYGGGDDEENGLVDLPRRILVRRGHDGRGRGLDGVGAMVNDNYGGGDDNYSRMMEAIALEEGQEGRGRSRQE